MNRTPQQAMRDAIVSGAVQAWIEGESIQHITEGFDDWIDWGTGVPPFALVDVRWRIKPIPQKPTVADWRPISEIPKDGKKHLVRYKSGHIDLIYSDSCIFTESFSPPPGDAIISFAPLPE